MSALAIERETPKMNADNTVPGTYRLLVAASVKIFQGALVVLNATGFAEPAVAAGSLVAAGVAKQTVDNTTGIDGALKISVEPGVFKFANKGGDLVVQADVGLDCYIENDQTVRHTSTSSSRVGKVIQIDTDGVWVQTAIGL